MRDIYKQHRNEKQTWEQEKKAEEPLLGGEIMRMCVSDQRV